MVLSVLHPTAEAGNEETLNVDIVAVHGLNGDPVSTWTNPKSKAFWLRDYLPLDVIGAWILNFGYNADAAFGNTIAGITDYAKDLLQSPATDIKRNAYLIDATRFLPPSVLHRSSKMPPLHAPLRSISGNRPKGSEISPYMRGQVKGKASEGAKPTAIAKALKLNRSTVNYTLKQDELRD